MSANELSNKKCRPCEGDVPPLTHTEVETMLQSIWGWHLTGQTIEREFGFKDFTEALAFVNRVGKIAEGEGHHPDLNLYQYNRVKITLWTHAVHGLTENDFIVAAKINGLF